MKGPIGIPVIGQLFLTLASQRVSDMWYSNALPQGKPANDFAEPARKVLSNGGIFCLASLTQTWSYAKYPSLRVTQPVVVMWGGSDRTHRRSNPNSVLPYLQRGKIMVFPEAGHFPELEDPERLKSLLMNEDLWNDVRLIPSSPPAETELRVIDDTTHDGSSTASVSEHNVGRPGKLAVQRKRFDSHL
jgi:pimeloyl-ACP methyl ester carboxylesterase